MRYPAEQNLIITNRRIIDDGHRITTLGALRNLADGIDRAL